ncbi:MAG: hypothetical protein VX815_15875 [Gemmatimonadota bacterium]|nr:hypothetical protein [Gemmatimonadota bacterium]
MLIGHLAVALGAKKIEPEVPLGATVAAAFALDLVWPILLLAGVEVVRVSPGNTAFMNLAFEAYPWTHSLALVLGWSVLGALVAKKIFGSWRSGLVLGALVLSHWLLDVVTHRPDLPMWPGGPMVGLGLWNSIAGTIVVEAGLLAVGLWMYRSASESADRVGTVALWALVGVTSLLWVSQPWAPPPGSPNAVAWGALVLWIFPPWAVWIERHRSVRVS